MFVMVHMSMCECVRIMCVGVYCMCVYGCVYSVSVCVGVWYVRYVCDGAHVYV